MPRLAVTLLLVLFCASALPAPATAAGPPANVSPPKIDDAGPLVGDTLHAIEDAWDDPLATVAYQWRRCDEHGACVDVQDAPGNAYTVTADDARSMLQVRATATNAEGSTPSDYSVPTEIVPDVPPQNTAKPSIVGTPRSGETLTAEDGEWSGTSPDITRQWLRCDGAGGSCSDIAGATGPTLSLGGADEGHTIRVRVTASNRSRQAEEVSEPTAPVPRLPVPVTNVTPPVLTGAPVVGTPLISSTGTWAGTPPFLLTRRWQRCPGDEGTCAEIPGRVSDIYFVAPADIGSRIRVVVRASNEAGAGSAAASALSAPVTTGGPPPTSPPPATTAAAGSFEGRPRRADLARALQGRLKIRGRCTGPCRIAVQLTVSRTIARKRRVPRTVAVGRRELAAAGTAVVRPRFATTTRLRLRPLRKLVVVVTARVSDGAGEHAAQRRWKLSLTR